MNRMPFMTHFKDGTPTFFAEKIAFSIAIERTKKAFPELQGNELIQYAKAALLLANANNPIFNDEIIPKLHTIRESDHFAKRFDAGKKEVVMYNWHGKPYGKGSNQIEIAKVELTGYQKIAFAILKDGSIGLAEETFKEPSLETVAKLILNDGLEPKQFREHFGVGQHIRYIYHWTDLRY